MKKLIILSLAFVMTFAMSGATALAVTTTGDVDTTLTSGSSDLQSRPIVKAKWEMLPEDSWGVGPLGEPILDDNVDEPGAQFNAPGVWNGSMNYMVCAVVTDPNGVADVDLVSADIYYPLNRPMHLSPSDPSDPAYDGDEIDNPEGGCGAWIEENTLIKLDKQAGIDLFCDDVRNYNENLVKWNPAFNFDEVCNNVTGELPQEHAYVYCDPKTLTWEDPAGLYKVSVAGHDSDGPGIALENCFEYVAYTGFAVDFTSVDYKDVLMNVRTQVGGDRDFSTPSMPTVRNIGNTRLNMMVAQDDMEFNQRDGSIWNVQYDARVGHDALDWADLYDPFKKKAELGDPETADYTILKETLDLSETEKMDFAVLVSKFHLGTEYSYAGGMWLDAQFVDFNCAELCDTCEDDPACCTDCSC